MARRIVLHSSLDPAALANKLRVVVGDRTTAPGKAGVTGQGSESKMLLFYYRPNFHNSFATRLSATMTADGGGTRIDGTIGVAGAVKVFMGFWFGFLTLFVVAAGGGMIAARAPLGATALFLSIPLTMMAFGALLWRVGTWNGKKDEAAILDFLATTVDCRERNT